MILGHTPYSTLLSKQGLAYGQRRPITALPYVMWILSLRIRQLKSAPKLEGPQYFFIGKIWYITTKCMWQLFSRADGLSPWCSLHRVPGHSASSSWAKRPGNWWRGGCLLLAHPHSSQHDQWPLQDREPGRRELAFKIDQNPIVTRPLRFRHYSAIITS